jgi:hypothetical protein
MYNTIGLEFVYISNTVVKIWTEKPLFYRNHYDHILDIDYLRESELTIIVL